MLDLSGLPKIDEGSAHFLNVARRYFSQPVQFAIDGETTAEIEMTEEAQFPDGAELVVIILDSDMGLLSISMDVATIDHLSNFYLEGWQSEGAANVPFPWRAVCCLERVIMNSVFADLTCQVLNVFPPECPPKGPETVFGLLCCEGRKHAVAISLVNGDESELVSRCGTPTYDTPDPSPELTFETAIEVLGADETSIDLDTVSVGDVLILAGSTQDNIQLRLNPRGTISWAGHLSSEGQFTPNLGEY